MIPKEKELKLISIYFFVCDLYEKELFQTSYLFTCAEQRYFSIKEIHSFARDYLTGWFPKLPSYKAFCARVNLLANAFQFLAVYLIASFKPKDCSPTISLLDSMPIFTCTSKNRKGKVAPQLTSKGYCAFKDQYYYGCKLHALTARRQGTIPFPEALMITPAEDNDLTAFKQAWGDDIYGKIILADKIYSDFGYFNPKKKAEQQIEMLTPVKAIKGQCEELKQRDKAFNELFSRAVSKVRQPIEAFFNWLNEKTTIQRAMKVRSTNGLLIHIYGKLAIAFLYLIF
ncbi:IS4/IS5 family transposase [Tannerella forsythia]|uniref:IS4/IS5 family transposase n=2 Tax=Tannerella forsythia TaxID=28112 RepID=A0A3P1XDV0_TANFO|nr:IS4/IS5 family transposase [Tannerella forsythia]